MNKYLVRLRNAWVELPEWLKKSLTVFMLFIMITSYIIYNYADEYISFLNRLSLAESLLLNYFILGVVLFFVIFTAFSSRSGRDVASAMGYNFRFTSPPIMFGKRRFRMVGKLKNGIRLGVPYSSDYKLIETRDKLQDMERDISCKECGNEYGDTSMRSMYFIIEGYTLMFLGFQIGPKKVEEGYGYCGHHYQDYAEDNGIEVYTKYDLSVGESVNVEYGGKSVTGSIKNINKTKVYPSAARLRDRNHPENPEERVFYIECGVGEQDIIYDLSDRVWADSERTEKLSDNGTIYHTRI